MCPGDVTSSFEENLRSLPGWNKKQNIVKIIIPRKFRRDILKVLDDMNITRATLFPWPRWLCTIVEGIAA